LGYVTAVERCDSVLEKAEKDGEKAKVEAYGVEEWRKAIYSESLEKSFELVMGDYLSEAGEEKMADLFRLRPYLPNLRKRLIKTPKLYFFDSGLLCFLLGIRDPEQLRHHPMRGAVFESWIVSEVMKAHYHRGVSPSVFFFQDRRGLEVDLVVERGGHEITAAEIKSGATLAGDFLKPLDSLREALAEARGPAVEAALLYGGEQAATRRGVRIVPWARLDRWVRTLV
jgi:predicted AAA+ superfamily ATPase